MYFTEQKEATDNAMKINKIGMSKPKELKCLVNKISTLKRFKSPFLGFAKFPGMPK